MKDDSPTMTDGPITQQKPAWYSRDGDPVSKGSFVNSLLAGPKDNDLSPENQVKTSLGGLWMKGMEPVITILALDQSSIS